MEIADKIKSTLLNVIKTHREWVTKIRNNRVHLEKQWELKE